MILRFDGKEVPSEPTEDGPRPTRSAFEFSNQQKSSRHPIDAWTVRINPQEDLG